jgi:hypothetical protein
VALTWRTDGDSKVWRVGKCHLFRVSPIDGLYRLTDQGRPVGVFGTEGGAQRAAHELVKALIRVHSGLHTFGRSPNRYGDGYRTPVRVLRGKMGCGPD